MSVPFVHPYIPNSDPAIRSAMLEAIGASSIEELYADIPGDLRFEGPLDLPAPQLAEQDLERHVGDLLARNRSARERLHFLGAGTYQHHVPAVVDEVVGRSEFLTAYAGEPYEDHGRFQALFEYQSLMGELLEMDVVNVPTYDGFQAMATSIAMTYRLTGRPRALVVSDVHPDMLSRVTDFLGPFVELVHVPTTDGVTDVAAVRSALDASVCAVWVQSPSFHGALEAQIAEIAASAHAVGALLVVGTDPICLGVIEPPALQGADLVCGDIQSLGVHQWFGGGHAGFIATADDERLVMEFPSRLFGLASTDVPGEYGFGDVAWERTSFALREEGKEWVGTAGALWGIAAAVYLSLMGPVGMVDVGETIIARTAYAADLLAGIPGVRLVDDAIHFREFVIDVTGTGMTAAAIVGACRRQDIEPGVVIAPHQLLVCVTEMSTQHDIDRLAVALAQTIEETRP